jgi:hypothetical protein
MVWFWNNPIIKGLPLKIITTRTLPPSDSTLSIWAARQRSGIPSFLYHILICLLLGAMTFFFGNSGGLVFVGGACLTLCAIGLLIRRIIVACAHLIQLVRFRFSISP